EVNELQPAFRRARLHGAVETLLAGLLPNPTLVLLEDVHWIDEASSELLRHLGATNTTRPWAICCTRRPGSDGFVAATGTPPAAAGPGAAALGVGSGRRLRQRVDRRGPRGRSRRSGRFRGMGPAGGVRRA